MIVYKFKNLEPFEQVVDLLVNERVYCPTPEQLNDPLEGVLGVNGPNQPTGLTDVERIALIYSHWEAYRKNLNTHRVCSFSKSYESPLMWSYYGNGHSGICFELDVSDYASDIFDVKYIDDLSTIDHSSLHARLLHKLKLWAHEQEVRVVLPPQRTGQYLAVKVKSVLIGTRLAEKYFKPLFELCRLKCIEVNLVAFDTSAKPTRVGWNLSSIKPSVEIKN